jgi:hypothetical protein
MITRGYSDNTIFLAKLVEISGGSGRNYSLTVSGDSVNGLANSSGSAYWSAIKIG